MFIYFHSNRHRYAPLGTKPCKYIKIRIENHRRKKTKWKSPSFPFIFKSWKSHSWTPSISSFAQFHCWLRSQHYLSGRFAKHVINRVSRSHDQHHQWFIIMTFCVAKIMFIIFETNREACGPKRTCVTPRMNEAKQKVTKERANPTLIFFL